MSASSELERETNRVVEGDRMTDDVEATATESGDAAGPRKQRTAEEAMRVTVIKSVAVSVPLAIAIFVGMVASRSEIKIRTGALTSRWPPGSE